MFEKTLNAAQWETDDKPLSDRWSEKNSYDVLVNRAREIPNKPALSFQLQSGENDASITYNYEELRARVAQAANAFRSLGLGDDDVVAYILPNCMEAVVANLGGMTSGIVNPINPIISPEHIGGILAESGAKAVVTLAGFPKTEVAQDVVRALEFAPNVEHVLTVDLKSYISGLKSVIVSVIRPKINWPAHIQVHDFNELLDQQSTDLGFEPNTNTRAVALFHTGGTTGRPKLVQHTNDGTLYNGWLGQHLIYEPDDVVLCPLPMFHVFAAYPILSCVLMTGAHMVMITPQGYRGEGVFENYWKLVERWKGTLMIMVPTAAGRLMSTPVNADVSTLRLAICGSAPLPQGLFDRFEEATGVRILEGYGMTEATCLVAVNPLIGDRKVGSVGYPLPYTDVKILDCASDGSVKHEFGANEIGEICILNPGVWVGKTYTETHQNEGLFANGTHLRTGDLGRIDDDGVLWITGRAKDLIIRGGHNIDPAMIEEALATHPAVAFVGAIGQPDSYAGELPCAYVELVEGKDVTVDQLMDYASENVAEDAAAPKYIEIMDELPKTAVGKVFKPDLRRRAITRVFSSELANAGLPVEVVEVLEDKQRGLVAVLRKTADCDDAKLNELLGKFTVKTEVQ